RQRESTQAARAGLAEVWRLQKDERWVEAIAAARALEGWVVREPGVADLLHEVRDLLADLELVKSLENLRLMRAVVQGGRFDLSQADAAYEAAFRAYGVGVEEPNRQEAEARLRRGGPASLQLLAWQSVRRQLAAALDDWALVRKTRGRRDWTEPLAVAPVADLDGHRNLIRDVLERGDHQRLRRLMQPSPDVKDWPAATIALITKVLVDAGQTDAAVFLLREAQRYRRGEFWINYDLALLLRRL